MSVDQLVELVLEQFQSRQVTDVKSTLQLLERALEALEGRATAGHEMHAL